MKGSVYVIWGGSGGWNLYVEVKGLGGVSVYLDLGRGGPIKGCVYVILGEGGYYYLLLLLEPVCVCVEVRSKTGSGSPHCLNCNHNWKMRDPL